MARCRWYVADDLLRAHDALIRLPAHMYRRCLPHCNTVSHVVATQAVRRSRVVLALENAFDDWFPKQKQQEPLGVSSGADIITFFCFSD
jgi:hypothetical protein